MEGRITCMIVRLFSMTIGRHFSTIANRLTIETQVSARGEHPARPHLEGAVPISKDQVYLHLVRTIAIFECLDRRGNRDA